MSDDYPWDLGRDEPERAFLRRLAKRSSGRGLFDAWTFYDQLVVTLTVRDDTGVLRTLRVDFDGEHLVGGNDPSHQITESQLDKNDPDHFEVDGAGSPQELADRAYEWFRREAARPIDRHEWDGEEHGWFLWVLADAARPLSARYLNRPDRPPDRVIRLESPRL